MAAQALECGREWCVCCRLYGLWSTISPFTNASTTREDTPRLRHQNNPLLPLNNIPTATFPLEDQDIIKINLDDYAEADKEFGLQECYKNATIFREMLNGKKSMSGYFKCDIFPPENEQFTSFISPAFAVSLETIIKKSNKAKRSKSPFNALYEYILNINTCHGVLQGRIRWDLNMHHNHEWNPSGAECLHHHTLQDKYNEKYNHGTPKHPFNGKWKYRTAEDERRDKPKWFIYDNENELNSEILSKEDIVDFENAPPSIQFEAMMKQHNIEVFDSCWDIIKGIGCDNVKKISNDVMPFIPTNIKNKLDAFVDTGGVRYMDAMQHMIHVMNKKTWLGGVQKDKKEA
eukprot:594607_1